MENKKEMTTIACVAHNIVSPLGLTTADNLRAVMDGKTCLKRYDALWQQPAPVVLSLMPKELLADAFTREVAADTPCSRFEQMALLSATRALAQCDVDPASPRVVFLLATTKGNVALLHDNPLHLPDERISPAASAQLLARHFGNPNMPLVVSNACTSGVCAYLEAARLLRAGCYDTAVVVGADEQSPFIVSGFQSLHALSPHRCQPFSENRMGLNLGEAAATMVLQRVGAEGAPVSAEGFWTLAGGAINNDGYHLSAPSKQAEGASQALTRALSDAHVTADELAVVSVHGTATLYNDEMEAKALHRAGLAEVPVSGLKGYFGHTMGAAGVLETILTQQATDNGCVLATAGFDALGVSKPVRVSASHRPTDKRAFVKMLSGFGGCNAAAVWKKGGVK